ncbi:phosphomannomutase/phosphoglucomutase [Candidatus Peregrinibacteria bacterium]|nr:phosphomannomutase/phosphoglucomutase [Candidatus Peregrinibacteria bacterium]
MIDQKIFRAYDIRGTYPQQLNKENAALIGKAFGTYLIQEKSIPSPRVAVGQDCRTHSMELFEGFTEGLMSTGCEVTNVGITPSPYVYFVVTEGKFDGGCNITASHNSKEFNGFKLMLANAHAVFGDEIQKIYKLIENGDFSEGKGSQKTADYADFYIQKIKSVFPVVKPLKVVIDTGNGVAGKLYPKVIRALGHEVVELYTELDGTFPNHEADPIIEANMEDLKKKVIEVKADLGLGFDGDGDRVVLISEKGAFINSDHLLMLLSRDVLSRHPGGTLVFTVSNSQALFNQVKSWGGEPVMCKVGHSYVENAMSRHKAILGGEQSGHFFLPENYYPYDDALVTACRILKIVSDADKPVSGLFGAFPKTFAIPEIRPYCPDDKKFEVLEEVVAHFKDKYPSTTMDGIRIDFGQGGWCGIRVSNTSPRLSIIMEAESESHLNEIKQEIMEHLKNYSEIDWNA